MMDREDYHNHKIRIQNSTDWPYGSQDTPVDSTNTGEP